MLDRVAPGVFDGQVDPARVWAFLATRVNEIVVALDRGDVVGFAFGTVQMRPDKPTEFFVNEIGVHPDYRRQRVASRLLDRLRELATDRGCEGFWVLTDKANAAALGLYRETGGEETPDLVMFDWDLP